MKPPLALEAAMAQPPFSFEHVVESSNEAICVVDRDLRIVYANSAAATSLGCARDHAAGQTLLDFCLPENRADVTALLQAARAGKAARERRRVRRHDGATYPALFSARACQSGSFAGVVVVITALADPDAPEAVAQPPLDERCRDLENRMLQAQKLDSLSVLAGGVAHEFNNLLTSILGNADLAMQDLPSGSPVCESIHNIESASRRGAEISQQLLAYSGRRRMAAGPLVVPQLVRDMIRMLELAVSKRVTIRASLPEAFPRIDGDPDQLRHLLMNLVVNGAESMAGGVGEIRISTSVLKCDGASPVECHDGQPLPPGEYAVLQVTDNGGGMTPEARARAFETFFTTKASGRGLGLPAVVGIVRNHRGGVSVETAAGQGTTIRVFLPLIEPAGTMAAAQDVVAPACPATAGGSPAVLVVDDEESVRLLALKMVERCGYRAVAASSGTEAVRLVGENPAGYLCVLLDLTMPGVDGEATLRELRKVASRLPIIMCSGHQALDLSERFSGKGATDFIQKPYRLADIKAKLQAVIH
jgi:two-component system, cell cycle sensor histidine kinase and response regulator CckA